MLNTEVVQVSAGRTQKAGVTKSGRLILWEVSDREAGAGVAVEPWMCDFCEKGISVHSQTLGLPPPGLQSQPGYGEC